MSVTYFTDMAATGKKTQNLRTYSISSVLMATLLLPIKVLTTLVTAINKPTNTQISDNFCCVGDLKV